MEEEEYRETLESEESEEATVNEVDSLKKELAEERAKAEANLAGWQRAQADFTNYKRRGEQEKEETIKFSNASLMLKILPIFDDFERAVSAIPPELEGNSWADGVRLIERKLRSSLEAHGLSPIEATGQPFDPRLHEAVRQEKGKDGIVVQEVEKGYTLFDRVLRASKVSVGNGEE